MADERLTLPLDQANEFLEFLSGRQPDDPPAREIPELWPVMPPTRSVWRSDAPPSRWLNSLIYGHGVVLPDPFDQLRTQDTRFKGQELIYPLHGVHAALVGLKRLAPLANHGMVLFYPVRHSNLLARPGVEMPRSAGDLPINSPRGRELAIQLTAVFDAVSQGRGQFFLDPAESRYLSDMLSGGLRLRDDDSRRMSLVLNSMLTTVDRPSVNTILRLREDSEVFAEWRSSLSRALTHALSADANEMSGPSAARRLRRALLDEIEPARLRLRSELANARALDVTVTEAGALGFLAGAAEIAVGASVAEALVPAGVAATGTSLASYVKKRRAVRRGRALLDYYAHFEPVS